MRPSSVQYTLQLPGCSAYFQPAQQETRPLMLTRGGFFHSHMIWDYISMENEIQGFAGFAAPESNYVRIPVEWFELTGQIDGISELRAIQYVVVRVWNSPDFDPNSTVSLDDLVSKTGLDPTSVVGGLERAVAHGFLIPRLSGSGQRCYRLASNLCQKGGA